MDTGIHAGVSFADYCALRAANKSGLDRLKNSPLHFYAEYLDPARETKKPSPAMELGTAIHTAILEPARFDLEYRAEPQPENFPGCMASLADHQAECVELGLPVSGSKEKLKVRILEAYASSMLAGDELVMRKFFDDIEREYQKYRLLSPDRLKIVRTIAGNVRASDSAQAILGAGKPEATFVWKDEETEVLCKGRADWLTDDLETVVDFKSAEDASPEGFQRACDRYDYHRQAAWYVDGVQAITGKAPLFVFAVYETSSPFAAAFYYATPEMLREGRTENRALLLKYAHCLKENRWPGYSEEILPIDLPAYRTKRIQSKVEAY